MRTPCRRPPGRHLRASNKPGAIHLAGLLVRTGRRHLRRLLVQVVVRVGHRGFPPVPRTFDQHIRGTWELIGSNWRVTPCRGRVGRPSRLRASRPSNVRFDGLGALEAPSRGRSHGSFAGLPSEHTDPSGERAPPPDPSDAAMTASAQRPWASSMRSRMAAARGSGWRSLIQWPVFSSSTRR